MKKYIDLNMTDGSKKHSISKILSLAFIGLLAVTGLTVAQSSGTPDVSIGQNGVQINTGGLDMGGTDISDGGTTVWDASTGNIATAVVDYSAATASDVGLGNVENIALSSATWTDLGISQSDVSKSDVGLSNVENENALAQDGSELMQGNLDLDRNNIINTRVISPDATTSSSAAGTVGSDDIGIFAEGASGDFGNIDISANGQVSLYSDANGNNGGPHYCILRSDDGALDCSGTKNWVQDLGNGSEAVYTSQESPEVRAVYEGETSVDGETRVEVPEHFSLTVSDTEPKLRATATVQGKLAYAAVIEKTDDYIVLDSSEPATVNYRITGIREGYEDKQVVRPKEE